MRFAWLMVVLAACETGGILEPDTSDSDPTGTDIDSSEGTEDAGTEADTDVPVSTVDYAATGGRTVTETNGSLTLADCALAYTTFVPAGGTNAPLVVLGHGFSRNKDNMRDVARHLASHGLRVVTPSYCHSTFLDADHAQNGADAVALSQAFSLGQPVVHMGFSAGGTSAIVAGASDPAAVAVMGLDVVESDGIAVAAAADLDLPLFGVVGDGSSCNSNNDGVPVYTAADDGSAVRVPGATHCDFEGPTGLTCTLLCGGESADPKVTIRALAAAFSVAVTGVDPGATVWITPGGTRYQELLTDGAIAPL